MLFVDTTVLVGAADRRDALHADGRRVLTGVAEGRLGNALVSDFVLDEAVTILGRRRGVGPKRAVAIARGVLESPRVRMLYVDAATFRQALDIYGLFGDALSFTDATTVALMRRAECDTLYSHDAGLDRVPGLVRRTTAP